MTEISWFVVGIIFGWFSTLSAVALGAYVVFRTKREPHEPFIGLRQPKGEAFNLGDPLEDEAPELPSIVKKMNERFKTQMPEGKAFNLEEQRNG